MSLPDFLCSVNDASLSPPYWGSWTSQSGGVLTGQGINGGNAINITSSTFLSLNIPTSSSVSAGMSYNVQNFGFMAWAFCAAENPNNILFGLQHVGDGRLQIVASSNPTSGGSQVAISAPSSAVMSAGEFYYIEFQALTTALPDGTFMVALSGFINQQLCVSAIQILSAAPTIKWVTPFGPGGGNSANACNFYIAYTNPIQWGELIVNADDATVAATNPNIRATQVGLEIAISVPQTLTLACAYGSGSGGTSYLSGIFATGGVTPYTYALAPSSGPLPPGLILDPATGIISGTPTVGGTYPYIAQVTDADGTVLTAACTITTTGGGGGLLVACPISNTAAVGKFYSGQVQAMGGTGALRYEIVDGSLPPGLSLNAVTGLISGFLNPQTGINPISYTSTWAMNDPIARVIYFGLSIGAAQTFTYTVTVTDSIGDAASATCSITIAAATAPTLMYAMNYRELDTAEQIFAGGPVRIGYSGKMIATDHSRKWTRWNVPANGMVILRTSVNSSEPVILGGNGAVPGSQGFGEVYTLDPATLTDDDYGQIYPYYTTYGFVNHMDEQALRLGSHRKQHVYSMMFAAGVGNIILQPMCDTISNPWPLIITRALSTNPKFDIEGPGTAQAQRIFFRVYTVPVSGTDNQMNVSKLVIVMRPSSRMPVRGAAR